MQNITVFAAVLMLLLSGCAVITPVHVDTAERSTGAAGQVEMLANPGQASTMPSCADDCGGESAGIMDSILSQWPLQVVY